METKDTNSVSSVSPGDALPDGPTAPESEELRARILSGVDDLVMNEGLQRLTMDRLAGHMAMSKKTIYTCFRSKTELVEALIGHIVRGVETNLLAIRGRSDLSTGEKIRLTRDTVIKRVSRLGMRLLDDLARVFPEIWRKVDARRAAILTEHFDAILREGAERGAVRHDVDIEMTTMLIVRTISRIGNPRELIDQPYSVSDLVSGLFSMLFTGVLSAGGVADFQDSGKSNERKEEEK